jgi:hypothetical protein
MEEVARQNSNPETRIDFISVSSFKHGLVGFLTGGAAACASILRLLCLRRRGLQAGITSF